MSTTLQTRRKFSPGPLAMTNKELLTEVFLRGATPSREYRITAIRGGKKVYLTNWKNSEGVIIHDWSPEEKEARHLMASEWCAVLKCVRDTGSQHPYIGFQMRATQEVIA